MEEVWRPIPGYVGIYEASNLGDIRSVGRDVVDGKGRTIHLKSVPLRPCESYNTLRGNRYFCGYQVNLRKDGKSKTWLVHRLVCKTWHPLIPSNASQVNHKDGNRRNNREDNLEWVSAQENIVHGYDNGLFQNRAIRVRVKDIDSDEHFSFESCSRLAQFLGKSLSYVTRRLQEGDVLEDMRNSHSYEVLFVDKRKKGEYPYVP